MSAEYVALRTTIPVHLDEALARLVRLSGHSKATFVRDALTEYLLAHDLVPPTTPHPVPRPTRGRGLLTHRKALP